MEERSKISKIGILGAGHLGITLAGAFIDSFLPKKKIFISFAGNPDTCNKLASLGLLPNIASNEMLCTQMDITFIFIRPQHFDTFKKAHISQHTLFVSGAAGVPVTYLKNIFGDNVCRIMTSGPDTIKNGKGIVAIWPDNQTTTRIMQDTGLTPFSIAHEDEMHYFTVGVCLPAVILIARGLKLDMERDIATFSELYPLFRKMYNWATDVIPAFPSKESEHWYIQKMATQGGITEAMVNTLNKTHNFLMALEAGAEKSRLIALHRLNNHTG